MSFLSWFGKKAAAPESLPEQNSDLGHVDATLPDKRHTHQPPPGSLDEGSHKKGERLERRELLYGVVRECMTAAGVLSSTYQFKVLSLDSSGRKYVIMVDMPHEHLASPAQFAEIEGVIARSAKERYDILVTAVYWRITDVVSASALAPHARPAAAHKAPEQPASGAAAPRPPQVPPASVASPASPYAELQKEEVLAFKRAVAAAAASGAARRVQAPSAPHRNPDGVPDFSDTEPFELPPHDPRP